MQILKIISKHIKTRKIDKATSHRHKNRHPQPGMMRVQAIVTNSSGYMYTRHMDIPKA